MLFSQRKPSEAYTKGLLWKHPSSVTAYNLKNKKKNKNKNEDFRSMPFKGLAFFADVKRKVVKTD